MWVTQAAGGSSLRMTGFREFCLLLSAPGIISLQSLTKGNSPKKRLSAVLFLCKGCSSHPSSMQLHNGNNNNLQTNEQIFPPDVWDSSRWSTDQLSWKRIPWGNIAANEAVEQIRRHNVLVAFLFDQKSRKSVKYSKRSPGNTYRAELHGSRENMEWI